MLTRAAPVEQRLNKGTARPRSRGKSRNEPRTNLDRLTAHLFFTITGKVWGLALEAGAKRGKVLFYYGDYSKGLPTCRHYSRIGGRVPFFVVRLLEALTRVVTNPRISPTGAPLRSTRRRCPLQVLAVHAARMAATDGRQYGVHARRGRGADSEK